MLTIFTNPAYDFIGKRRWAYAVSVAVMLLGLGSMLVKGGLQYDIDFTGGTLVELRLPQPVPLGDIRSRLSTAGLRESIIQIFDDPRDVLIRTHLGSTNATDLSRRIVGALDPAGQPRRRFAAWSSSDPRSERAAQASTVCGPRRARRDPPLRLDALRLQRRGGDDRQLGARRAHLPGRALPDESGVLPDGSGRAPDGDRILRQRPDRDVRPAAGDPVREDADAGTFAQQVNLAVNQTLSRTVLTVATIAMSAGMLFLFGGESLESFGFVVLVGALTGTTSTVYVAGALDVDWSALG